LTDDTCGLLKEARETEYLTDFHYVIEIGPTPNHWVRLDIEPDVFEVKPPALNSFCGAPPPALCSASDVPVSAPSKASLNPPQIQADTAYNVRLAGALQLGIDGSLLGTQGELAFVASRTGFYALDLGTPNFPVGVRQANQGAFLVPVCAGAIRASAACGNFGSTQFFELTAGTQYRIDFSSDNALTSVRLAMQSADPPPDDLPTHDGLALWLRSDSGVSLVGSRVAKWAYRSDPSRFAEGVTSQTRPRFANGQIGGLPIARFDGTSAMNFPALRTEDATIFFVAKSNAASTDTAVRPLLGSSDPASPSLIAYQGSDSLDLAGSIVPVGNVLVPRLFAIIKSGDSVSVEAAPGQNVSFPGATDFSALGHSAQAGALELEADLSELVIFNRVLSDAERTATEQYFNQRYALTP